MFVDAFVSMQNVHSYSPQLYSTLASDATLLKVTAEHIRINICIYAFLGGILLQITFFCLLQKVQMLVGKLFMVAFCL